MIGTLLGIIEVCGSDSKKFLQGQITNDINLLDDSFIYASHLNHKGRMLANFIIIKPQVDRYLLITVKDIVQKILPRLKMFILRSQVTIKEVDDLVATLSPQAKHESICLQDGLYLSLLTNLIDYDINEQKRLLINHCIPFVYQATYENFVPQHVSFEQGISFTKGCYTGQEIVARTHYLGSSKRSLYKFKSQYPVSINQALFSPLLANQIVGTVVDTVSDISKTSYIGLASIQNNYASSIFLDQDAKMHPITIQSIIKQD